MSTIIRRPVALAAALLLALLAAACGGESTSRGTTATGPTETVAPATTTAAATGPTLAERLPTSSEFVLFAAREPETVDLDGFVDAVSDDADADGDRAALSAAGFTRGIVQGYVTDEDAAFAQSFVAEVDEARASALLDRIATDLEQSGEPGIEVRPVAVEEAGARGVDIEGTAGATPVSGTALVFADGRYVYGVQVAHQSGQSLHEALRQTVIAWQARVAGSPPAPPDGTTTSAPVTTAPADTTASTPYPDAGEISLLARVPSETAANCGRTSDAERAVEATSSVRCDTATHRVYYEQFATVADMEESYAAYLTRAGIARGEGTTCDEGAPAEGTWDGPDNRVACFVDDAGAWVVWNSSDLRLVAVAIDPEAKLQRLFDWWKSPASGPVG